MRTLLVRLDVATLARLVRNSLNGSAALWGKGGSALDGSQGILSRSS